MAPERWVRWLAVRYREQQPTFIPATAGFAELTEIAGELDGLPDGPVRDAILRDVVEQAVS